MNTAVDVVTGEVVPTSASPLTPQEARQRATWVRDVTKAALTEGVDYGIVPGTGSKPSLLKPGAEMLLLAAGFGFSVERIPDDESAEHRGITYRCSVKRGDYVVAECDGYAGYDEKRFAKGSWRADWNSVIKMAQKRALVGASLNAVAGSGLFTQDMENEPVDPLALLAPHLEMLGDAGKAALRQWRQDQQLPAPSHMTPEQTARVLVHIGRLAANPPAATSTPEPAPPSDAAGSSEPTTISAKAAQRLHIVAKEHGVNETDLDVLIFGATNGVTDSAKELTEPQARAVENSIEDHGRGFRPANWDDVCQRWAAWRESRDAVEQPAPESVPA